MRISTNSFNHRTMLSLAVFGLLSTALVCEGPASSASVAQTEGLFTARQAARGSAVYEKSCASCHGSKLEGTTSAPLAGPRFASKWADGKHTVDDLYFVTRTQMPYGSPGTLTDQQYIDVVAFMLQSNGYRPGAKELTANSAS